jgi:hypothetical protein
MIQEIHPFLTAGERKSFRKHLAQHTRQKDGANLRVWDAIQAGNTSKLQQTMGANAFHVSSKRLADRLLEFLGQQSMLQDNPAETKVQLYLHLAQRLFAQGAHLVAWKTLRKAEKLAIALQADALKLEVYRLAVHYSYLPGSEDQHVLFEKTAKAERALTESLRLNMAYAQLRKQFQDMEYTPNTPKNISETIQHTLAFHQVTEDALQSFQVLYQLAEIADLSAFRRKNYHLADLYFADRVAALSGTTADGERTLLYHIDVLYLLAHISFRQRKFATCAQHLEKMEVQMERFNRKYWRHRHVRWATLKALNLAFSGELVAAANLLDALLSSRGQSKEEMLNPLLVRVMLHFLSGQHKDARHILAGFQHGDSFYSARVGQEWVLNRRYMEILLHIELDDFDMVDVRIRSLLRSYGNRFEASDAPPVKAFLKLIRVYCQDPQAVGTPKFREQVEKSLPWKAAEEEDVFLMSFYAWLKARMEGKKLYEVLLELVENGQEMSPIVELRH